jgi:hypothetical protein
MFFNIFRFELQLQFRRPAVYLYFAVLFIFSLGTFATGSLPLAEKEHINAPYILALWCAAISMVMALIGSSVMGLPIYRDIQYDTKQYYFTYPISESGYFWGRYCGAFMSLLFIASAMLFGAYIGTLLGPFMGWRYATQYGPNRPDYFLQPFFTIALVNLFFTASLFYGLVALTRNVKVIYGGGVLLFLGYFLSFFFLMNDHNGIVVNLADPFAINGVMLQANDATIIQKNTTLISFSGTFLGNRLLWTAMGLGILLVAYSKFTFGRFFNERRLTGPRAAAVPQTPTLLPPNIKVSFKRPYARRILLNLVKTELVNLIRDHYFWIILTSGIFFLSLAFMMGVDLYGIPELPRTVLLFRIFNDTFPFYIFLFLLFYTGEVLHRERSNGFAVINDTLPPSNRLLHAGKLLTLLLLGISLALLPVIAGISTQLAKGFHQFNLSLYVTNLFVLFIPHSILVVLFCYAIHVLINQKFAGHIIGLLVWIGLFFLNKSGLLDYHLLLYSYTPNYELSDMDGLGHLIRPIGWFTVYWLLLGGLLIILSALFYYRGVNHNFKQRLRLASQRLDARTKYITITLLLAFVSVGMYIYINVSYLNNYLTANEQTERKVIYENALKKYAGLPVPKVTQLKLKVDLYPDKQQASTTAWVTLINPTVRPITQLLIDADELTELNLKIQGHAVPFTYPLYYPRGRFNFFRPANEPAEFRLYHLKQALLPGDSLSLEVHSAKTCAGFNNDTYGQDLLQNGTFFKGGLPGLGYDPGEELTDPFERRRHHLPARKAEGDLPQDDPLGKATLKAGPTIDLLKLDVTISTAGDQIALAPGQLVKQWRQNGRNYFHYNQQKPGMYMPLAILSARYASLQDTVQLDHAVKVAIYYHPEHASNISRFMAAYKDGLHYFSAVYGTYPFNDMRLAETNVYQNKIAALTTLAGYSEDFAWNAHFSDPNQFDYAYFHTARTLAQQWWRFGVAPNNTAGSLAISEGLATYSALALLERKYGKANMRNIVLAQLAAYNYKRTRLDQPERPLLTMNLPEQNDKAGVVLYGLKGLIGEDRLNTALRRFRNDYAFKNNPPYAGNNDLYHYLQQQVPDALKYYLADNWLKVTTYNNQVTGVHAVPVGHGFYEVTLIVQIAKTALNTHGADVPARMNDDIDIGVFAAPAMNKSGRWQNKVLYLQKYRLTAGSHSITIRVNGKPAYAGIDPYANLIDRNAGDNLKNFD